MIKESRRYVCGDTRVVRRFILFPRTLPVIERVRYMSERGFDWQPSSKQQRTVFWEWAYLYQVRGYYYWDTRGWAHPDQIEEEVM